jgi:acetyl-CoA hydrolase
MVSMTIDSWPADARARLTTAEDAVASIKSGDRVYVQGGAATPQALLKAMTSRWQELNDVEVVHLHSEGPADYVKTELAGHFRHNALFIGANVREAVQAGRADFTPVLLSQVPGLFERTLPLDVALIHVSPPDARGFCSLGISVDCAKPACEVARTVVAQVNQRMPRTLGDSFVHVRDIRHLVAVDEPLVEVTPQPINDVARRIGGHVVSLIEDGATLQIGIGAVPNAVLAALRDHRRLGVHTEMFSDGLLDLIELGAVDCSAKSYHRGKIITAFVIGTSRLYGFVDDNPLVEMHPVTFTNDPEVIARNDNMVAINSAIEIDLTGQVCADSIGHKLYSGIGGQVDFIRGAARSKGGKSVIALPSTAAGGRVSRIVAELQPGAGVVTTRGDVHYVATENGVAELYGKTLRQRAVALINIAHPDFRETLSAQAKQFNLLW